MRRPVDAARSLIANSGGVHSMIIRIACAALLTIASISSYADEDFDPFPTSDRSPFAQIYGLPALEGPRLLPPSKYSVRLTYEAANHFIASSSEQEFLFLDGETHRTTLAVHYGTAFGEWGIEMPYVSHSGGFMDSFIENWHSTFGFPNGGRELFPRNQISYLYQRRGVDRVQLTQSTDGMGDVQLLGGWRLPSGKTRWDTALRASLKLPTGDASTLTGSGAADVAVWLTAGCALAYCPPKVRWNFSGGLLAVGRGDVLPELQRRAAAFGGATLGWQIWQPLVLKAEFLFHTPFYRGSDLRLLQATPAQLLLGGTVKLGSSTAFDVAIAEDINVRTAPDVTLVVNLRTSF
jgi:hypothetical protein